MRSADPQVGRVINYCYLWRDEARARQVEGLKDRPCLIVATDNARGEQEVLVHPITHSQPSSSGEGVELPQNVKAQLGLDNQRSWVITSETNHFTWSDSPDRRPVYQNGRSRDDYGQIPDHLFQKVRTQARQHPQAIIQRDDEPSLDAKAYRRGRVDNSSLRSLTAPLSAEAERRWQARQTEPDNTATQDHSNTRGRRR